MVLFKFNREDESNCRVYYRSNDARLNGRDMTHLYCIQNDGGWGKDRFTFYACSHDGEPSHPLRMPRDTSFDKKIMPRSVA